MVPEPTKRYEIQVAGRIAPERADWFDGMTLRVTAPSDCGAITVLSGPVADQAALFGILNRIRDLGLRLISVNTSEEGQ
ncbi:MAG: hypothetical protein NT169_15600 [Chloroflexi bacterium]|nr:hypothetical protein [Chloroflexota bacterium]